MWALNVLYTRKLLRNCFAVVDELKTDEIISVQEEERLLALFESRIQFVLKSLVKLSISSSNQK